MTLSTHDEYLKTVNPEARVLLLAIQQQVETLLPEASRCIGYKMPAYRAKRIFFYFAAFKKHIGIYPPVSNDAELIKELAPYRGPNGNLSFPLNQPLPIELIGRVALALYKQYCRV